MKIGKIIATTACSLLMSGAAFAEIAPTPADNSAFELSVVSEKISATAADDDYGKASSILSLFYDSSIEQAGIAEQTPVYAGEDYAGTQSRNNKTMYPGIPCSPADQSKYPNVENSVNQIKGVNPICLSWSTKKVCIKKKTWAKICTVGTLVCVAATGGGAPVCTGAAAVCSFVAVWTDECNNVPYCTQWYHDIY